MDSFADALRDIDLRLVAVPDWLISLAVILFVVLVAIWLHGILFRLAVRFVANKDLFWRSLVTRTRGPTRLALIIVGIAAGATASPLTFQEASVIRQGLLVAFIGLMGWVAITALNIWTTVYLRRFKLDTSDNLLARKHVTQSRILKRVADTVIVIITVSAALMTFEGVRQYGVSLLASAGAAGIIVGFALQPILKNLVAGVQLAVTQPIRIDDALVVEGEWGKVEEITSTYVVIRIWDLRRLILPLSYFIEQPFQNWTREGSALLGTVIIPLDYSMPIPPLRAKFQEILEQSPKWDREAMAVQVTDFRERTMEVRLLMSAATGGNAFELRCEVREKIIAWIQAEYPHALPRTRNDLTSTAPAEVVLRRGGNGRDEGSAAGLLPTATGMNA